jgi:hypothetical protein
MIWRKIHFLKKINKLNYDFFHFYQLIKIILLICIIKNYTENDLIEKNNF